MRTFRFGVVFRVLSISALAWGALLVVTVPTLAAPAAPGNLQATPVAGPPIGVALTWTDNSANEVGFRIERATAGGSFINISGLGVPANSVAFTDNTVTAGVTYSYRVIAFNIDAVTNSAPSNTATITAVVPAAPQVNLSLTPANQNVGTGSTFTVTVAVAPQGGQQVSAIDALVNFDPAVLQVDSIAMAAGCPLNIELQNAFDNTLGRVDYTAGKLSGTMPSTAFNMAVITFHSIATATASPITFSTADPRITASYYQGSLVTGTLTGAAVTVVPPPVANFTAAGAVSGTTTIVAGETVNFTDTSTGAPTSWTWDFGDGTTSTLQSPSHAYLTAGQKTVVLTATNSGVSNTMTKANYITVIPGPLHHLTVSPSSPSIQAGGNQTFTAATYDQYNNARSGDPITWSVNNAQAGSINVSTGAFTAGTLPGSYSNVIVATSGAITANASVTVTAGALDHIAVSPPNLLVAAGGNQTFTAATYDQYNNARNGDPVTWSVNNATAGSINSVTGIFTAGTVAGTYSNVVVATSGAVTGNTSVTVTAGALDHIEVSPANSSLNVSGGQTFTAATYDQYNNARSGDPITWSVNNAQVGSINASTGAFTAGTVPGSYSNVIVATSGAISANASVTVTAGALDHITVSPPNLLIAAGGIHAFTAATYDQFNNARSGDPITWTVSNPTAGSINASTGAFTAGTTAGSYSNVIVATSGAVTGNTSVTVRDRVTVFLDLPQGDAVLGQPFNAAIMLSSGASQISAVDVFLNFDPAVLEVRQVQTGATLPVVLVNTYNNVAGTLDYSACLLSGVAPSGAFSVATVTFWAKQTTASTNISFSASGSRTTIAAFDGDSYLDESLSAELSVTYDPPLSLLPADNLAYVGQYFTITLETNASQEVSISAVDAFIDFDPAYLEVVDADGAAPGIQVSQGAMLPSVLNNSVDNATGHIDFSAGNLTGTPPAGSFLVATITFRAKVETPGTSRSPITISVSGSRMSMVALSGNPIQGTHSDSGVDIDVGATVHGSLTLQGGLRPASGRVVPLTVKLFTPGSNVISAVPLATYTPNTVDSGTNLVTFRIDGVLPATYDITVSGPHTLHNVKRNVVVSAPSTSVSFGTLLEGNANNDTIINALDFSILASSYMKSTGQAGFDARADFDVTGTVNALDFSLLAADYMKVSPLPV